MPAILRIDPARLNRAAILTAAAAIRGGKVVAMPTDTVYGLAVDPFQPAAVLRLLRLKGRPPDKPVLLLVESVAQAEALAGPLPETFRRVVDRYWPGPLTVVVPASTRVPARITCGAGTVAVRMPGSIFARELIRAAGAPLTGTSANRSGKPAAVTARQVAEQFPYGLTLIVDGGPARRTVPSTIVDLTGKPEVLREGAIPAEDVLSLCQR